MSTATDVDDRGYAQLLEGIQVRFRASGHASPQALFATDCGALFETFLAALPEAERSRQNCSACRRFMERFGGLVEIDGRGATTSPFWSAGAGLPLFGPATEAVAERLRSAAVTGVFVSDREVWGVPSSPKNAKHGGVGSWQHLHAIPPESLRHRSAWQTPSQAMAAKREDRATLARALAEFPLPLLERAVKLLGADVLYRSEKVLGAAEWLVRVHQSWGAASGARARDNVLWRAAAQAPAGFCHPRSSVIGTLLEDLAAGRSVAECERAFAAKMHPLRYQRPQAAPSAGNIEQAEKLVAQLGIARSLERRFARLEEIEALWRSPEPPQLPPDSDGRVFAHLVPRHAQRAPLDLPPQTLTWEKFARQVLPAATGIELLAPERGAYMALTTAVHADAPPILRWDHAGRRNPFAWYLWHGGSPASQWGLAWGWVAVTAIAALPPFWFGHDPKSESRARLLWLLAGARETRLNGGLALFPECLRSELHGVRSTLEAYSRSGRLQGAPEGSACGLHAGGGGWPIRLRVQDADGDRREYVLDRWD